MDLYTLRDENEAETSYLILQEGNTCQNSAADESIEVEVAGAASCNSVVMSDDKIEDAVLPRSNVLERSKSP
jgi:hypothetical protein